MLVYVLSALLANTALIEYLCGTWERENCWSHGSQPAPAPLHMCPCYNQGAVLPTSIQPLSAGRMLLRLRVSMHQTACTNKTITAPAPLSP